MRIRENSCSFVAKFLFLESYGFRLFDNFPAAPFADARPPVVAYRRMIEIRHAASGLENQLPNARHLLEVDLLDAVGIDVIVGMQPSREKNNRDAFGRVAVMIAAIVDLLEIGGIVHFEIELERL